MDLWWRSKSDTPVGGDAWSDARPAPEAPAAVRRDPELARRSRLQRRAAASILAGLFAAGAVVAVVGKGGLRDLVARRAEVAALREQISDRQARLARTRDAVVRLESDPLARERIAREQLGLVRPGEVSFVLPRGDAHASD